MLKLTKNTIKNIMLPRTVISIRFILNEKMILLKSTPATGPYFICTCTLAAIIDKQLTKIICRLFVSVLFYLTIVKFSIYFIPDTASVPKIVLCVPDYETARIFKL